MCILLSFLMNIVGWDMRARMCVCVYVCVCMGLRAMFCSFKDETWV